MTRASYTSRPNSAQRRLKSSVNIKINLVDSNYFFISYSVQLAFKSRDNKLIGGSRVSRSYSAQTVTVRKHKFLFLEFHVMFLANKSVAFRITAPESYHIQRVIFSALIYHISRIKYVFLSWIVMFGTHFCTVKLKVEIVYTNITCRASYFETISCTDWVPMYLERVMFLVYI